MVWSRICQSRNNKQCFGQEYVNLATISNVLLKNMGAVFKRIRIRFLTPAGGGPEGGCKVGVRLFALFSTTRSPTGILHQGGGGPQTEV